MGRSLLTCVFSFGIVFHSACAGPHDMIEPYQVLDIRMEEGVKGVLATRRDVEESNGNANSAAFLANQEEHSLRRLASLAAAQKAESASLSNIVEHVKGP